MDVPLRRRLLTPELTGDERRNNGLRLPERLSALLLNSGHRPDTTTSAFEYWGRRCYHLPGRTQPQSVVAVTAQRTEIEPRLLPLSLRTWRRSVPAKGLSHGQLV